MKSQTTEHPNSKARDFAVQFLYQCECEKLFHFSEVHFSRFAENFEIPDKIARTSRNLVEGCLKNLNKIDTEIQGVSQIWSLERMATTDRCVLRMACFEMMQHETPRKVVMNEAIELAKKYGTENSGAFVNGILDKVFPKLMVANGN